MHLKKTNLFILLFISLFLMGACSGVKNVAYLQKLGASTDSLKHKQSSSLYNARIKPQDLLSITVVTSEPETSRIYNLVVPQISENTTNNLTSIPTLQNYLVDNDGNIDFPVFGKLNVKGLTRKELEAVIQDKLASAFSKERPIVTIRITNYSVNIVGEVARPGKFVTNNDRLTIFEGLALAGDISIFGRRDNVKVLRENADGTKKIITVNLNDENIINSPVYYLEQNDVVYVEPNKSKANSSYFGSAESFGISALSILFSLASLVITILHK